MISDQCITVCVLVSNQMCWYFKIEFKIHRILINKILTRTWFWSADPKQGFFSTALYSNTNNWWKWDICRRSNCNPVAGKWMLNVVLVNDLITNYMENKVYYSVLLYNAGRVSFIHCDGNTIYTFTWQYFGGAGCLQVKRNVNSRSRFQHNWETIGVP